MSQNSILLPPSSFELDNYVFNPIATVNIIPTNFLVYRPGYEIKDAMNKYTDGYVRKSEKMKLVPKDFNRNAKDGQFFQQKNKEKSILVTKITTHQIKISGLIDEIQQKLREPPKFIDYIDSLKQKKLFADFNIEEIRFYQIDHYSYFERSTNHLIIKVSNLFATIMRALQIYQKQIINTSYTNSDKLLQFMQLVVSGLNVCVELKIFDEDDILIKLLLEKLDDFITFLRENSYNEETTQPNERRSLTSISTTSLAKDIFTPLTHRYAMYAPNTPKMKTTRSITSFSKATRNEKCGSAVQSTCNEHSNKSKKMFESSVTSVSSGNSSMASDVYQEVIKQNNMLLSDRDENQFSAETQAEVALELLCLRK